ncbi:hypothetical protein Tco_1098534 [Tanacetum coccineum]
MGDYGVAGDDYEGPPVFDDDQYEDVIKEEEGFVDNYPNFQEDENNLSYSGVVLRVEEESMPIYDTDFEDVIEEEGFVGKGGFGEEEDNMEDVVVVANDIYSSKIQTTVSVDFSKNKDSNPHELILLQKGNLVEITTKSTRLLSLYMRCSTDESRCYGYTLDGQRMSRDAIVVHEMFSGGVEMLSLDVKRRSRDAIVVHEKFNSCNPVSVGIKSPKFLIKDYGMASDDYEGPPVFDDDQYKDVIEEEEGFVDNYPNFQKDETNVSFSVFIRCKKKK